jgi:hypothetical protein
LEDRVENRDRALNKPGKENRMYEIEDTKLYTQTVTKNILKKSLVLSTVVMCSVFATAALARWGTENSGGSYQNGERSGEMLRFSAGTVPDCGQDCVPDPGQASNQSFATYIRMRNPDLPIPRDKYEWSGKWSGKTNCDKVSVTVKWVSDNNKHCTLNAKLKKSRRHTILCSSRVPGRRCDLTCEKGQSLGNSEGSFDIQIHNHECFVDYDANTLGHTGAVIQSSEHALDIRTAEEEDLIEQKPY